MNTDYDRITLDDIKTNGVYIAFGKENVVMGMINGGQTYEYSTMDLDKLFYDGFNNDQLASAVPAFYVAIVIMYIAIMFGSVIKMIFLALVFSIVARTLAKGLHTGLSYGNVFRVCLYGLTLPMLLTSVNTCLDFLIPSSIMFVITLILAFSMINRGIASHVGTTAPPEDWL